MYHGKKSCMQNRLQSCQTPTRNPQNPKAIIIEASLLLRKLSNVIIDNFYELAMIFFHHVVWLAKGCKRLDVVFGRYFSNSRKTQILKDRKKEV